MSFTILDGLNGLAAGAMLPCPGNGLQRVWDNMAQEPAQTGELSASFGDVRLRPRYPLRLDTPSRLETSPDCTGTGGRAGAGLLPSIQKPAPARLIRPNRF